MIALTAVVNTFLLVYAGLFPIVNPVGSAPIFLALTTHQSEQVRRELARRVALNSFALLLGSLFVGAHVLSFFGITLPVLRIAGGLAVSSFGWQLLRDGVGPPADLDAVGGNRPIDAFYPLTMPLTVGPGSIAVAVAVALGAQRPEVLSSVAEVAIRGAVAMLALVAMAATIFLCYRFAHRMVRVLGPSGINVLVRLSAFILLCIGIQITGAASPR